MIKNLRVLLVEDDSAVVAPSHSPPQWLDVVDEEEADEGEGRLKKVRRLVGIGERKRDQIVTISINGILWRRKRREVTRPS